MRRMGKRKLGDQEKEECLADAAKKMKMANKKLKKPEEGLIAEPEDEIAPGANTIEQPNLEITVNPIVPPQETIEEDLQTERIDENDNLDLNSLLNLEDEESDSSEIYHKVANNMGLTLRIHWEKKLTALGKKKSTELSESDIFMFLEGANCEIINSANNAQVKYLQMIKDEHIKASVQVSKMAELVKHLNEHVQALGSLVTREHGRPESSSKGITATDRKMLLELGFSEKELNNATIYEALKPLIRDDLRDLYHKGIPLVTKTLVYRKLQSKVRKVLARK
ncbi:TPA_asm: P [Cypripedium betacytorhabdovirus 1]|nr:TPA_asm: P [Cypripedium betacytorhabdovirus 1]